MDHQRNRAFVYGGDDTFVRALRLSLADIEVLPIGDLEDLPATSSILIFRSNGNLPMERLAATATEVPTLVLADRDALIDALEANCRGFLPGSSSLEQVRDAIETILDGGAVVPPDLLGAILRHLVDRKRTTREELDLHALTNREREVFDLAVNGVRKDEIGQRLFISPDTARTHLQRVYRKLGVHSQAELVALAARAGEFDRSRNNE